MRYRVFMQVVTIVSEEPTTSIFRNLKMYYVLLILMHNINLSLAHKNPGYKFSSCSLKSGI
jgi:hypothetical protein